MTPASLRVLVTCDWFSPDTGGGAERVAYEVSRRLAAAGHQVTILATRPRDQRPFEVEPEIHLASVPAYSLSRFMRAQVSLAPGLPAATAKAIASSRPDVVWSHSLQFQSTLAAAVLTHRRRIPFVVSAHIADLRAVGGPLGLAARAHEATLGRLVLRLATRAIAVSDPVAIHIRSLAPRLAVDVVPNGVDFDRFHPGEPAPHAGLHVGFLGRLISNKGPDVAILAVAEATRTGVDARLSIAGDGPEEASLRRLASALGVGDRVRFEGHQASPESWLRAIDVLVRPSLTEGMPLGVLEAMAAGVPVIASDVPGNATILRPDDVGLLIPVGDHLALARALALVDRDQELRARMRAGGIRAASTFGWDSTAELTGAALRRAVEGFGQATAPGVAPTGHGAQIR